MTSNVDVVIAAHQQAHELASFIDGDPPRYALLDPSICHACVLVAEIEHLRDQVKTKFLDWNGLVADRNEARDEVERQVALKEDAYRQALANRAKVDAVEDLCNEWQLDSAAPTTRGHCADVIREALDAAS